MVFLPIIVVLIKVYIKMKNIYNSNITKIYKFNYIYSLGENEDN